MKLRRTVFLGLVFSFIAILALHAKTTMNASSTKAVVAETLVSNHISPTFAEAKRNDLNLVGALLNDGFRVRDGEWLVTLSPKKPVLLQVSFFAGNQYWLAASAAPPARKLKLTVYDSTGYPLKLDTWKDDGTVAGAREAEGFVASHSGRYFIKLELMDSKDSAKADTCLIYAYK